MADFPSYVLCSETITVPVTNSTVTQGTSSAGASQAFVDRFADATAITLVAQFTYGSAGTTAVVTIDTAMGSGGVWIPIARFDFATASLTKYFSLSGLSAITSAATIGTLSADSAINGLIGDRLRARLTTTGTYASITLLDVRVQAR